MGAVLLYHYILNIIFSYFHEASPRSCGMINLNMARKFEFAVGEYYHVYNRGNDKRDIFLDSADKNRFVALLYLSNASNPFHFEDVKTAPLDFDRGERLVDLGAYCLMTNHFHLLLRERQEGGISRFMHSLGTGYTMYFNKRRQRRGSLFEGNFRATHAGEDQYLNYLFAYIHLNPVKMIQADWREVGLQDQLATKNFLDHYDYSSYKDYLGTVRVENKILTRETFPEYFSTAKDFDGFLSDWLTYADDDTHEASPRGRSR